MGKERFKLIIMIEKIIYDHNDEPFNMGPIRNEYELVQGEHTTLKRARLAAEKLSTTQIELNGEKQTSSLSGEGQLPTESSDHRQHRSRDGSRV